MKQLPHDLRTQTLDLVAAVRPAAGGGQVVAAVHSRLGATRSPP
jgi:glutamate dehydrogenase